SGDALGTGHVVQGAGVAADLDGGDVGVAVELFDVDDHVGRGDGGFLPGADEECGCSDGQVEQCRHAHVGEFGFFDDGESYWAGGLVDRGCEVPVLGEPGAFQVGCGDLDVVSGHREGGG